MAWRPNVFLLKCSGAQTISAQTVKPKRQRSNVLLREWKVIRFYHICKATILVFSANVLSTLGYRILSRYTYVVPHD